MTAWSKIQDRERTRLALLGSLFGVGGLLLSGPMSVVALVLVKMLYVEDVLEHRQRRFAGRFGPAARHAPHREPS